MKADVNSMAPQLQEVKQQKTTYDQALAHLQNATKLVHQSQELLQKAQGRATADVFLAPGPSNGPLGMANDIQKRQNIQRAEMMYMQALQSLGNAKMVVPDIPNISEATIKQPRPFGDMFFDNIVSDMIVRKQIMKANEQMKQTLNDVMAATKWLNDRVSTDINPRYNRIVGEHKAKKDQLYLHRVQLFETAVQVTGA